MQNTQTKAIAEAAGGSQKSFGRIVYSEKHGQETDDMMLLLTEFKYKRTSQGSIPTPERTGTEIALPLPYNLETSYNMQWGTNGEGAMGEFLSKQGGDLLSAARDALTASNGTQKTTTLQSFLENKWNSLGQLGVDFASAIGTDMLTNNGLFRNGARGAGLARNPFLAATFEGVQFRIFNFQYKLSPKSRRESDNIEKIIKALKYGMHPSYQQFGGLKNALFTYPNIYLPRFTKGDRLFEFGYCVIRDLAVQYHDEGSPKYFDDNGEKIPAFINLTLSMMEIEIITKDTLSSPNGGNGK